MTAPSTPPVEPPASASEVAGQPVGPRIPRLPAVFDRGTLRRLLAEFLVIVVGVLVAFAVDDWQAARQQEAEAQRLLDLMEVDIRESVEDLREAVRSATVRPSAVVELLARIGEPLPPSDEWIPLARSPFSDVTGAARAGWPRLDGPATVRTLLRLTVYAQVFDPRTVAFDEFRSTGALASLPRSARGEIPAFYGRMIDFAESNQFIRDQGRALEAALESAGVAVSDWLPEEEILQRLRESPRALASLRRAYMRASAQREEIPTAAELFESQGMAVLVAARTEP